MFTKLMERKNLSEERINRRNAQLCAVIFNSSGRTKEGGGAFDTDDFMPKLRLEDEPNPAEMLANRVKSAHAMMTRRD